MAAVQEGLVVPVSSREMADGQIFFSMYRFLHDRVQQAAYAMIKERSRRAVRLKIGRLLLKSTAKEERNKRLFELVDHLNLGRELISLKKEKLALVRLNLEAGRKAKLPTAYASALEYVKTGLDLVGSDWAKQYDPVAALHKEMAELWYLRGNFKECEETVQAILERGKPLDTAEAYALLITQYTVLGRNKEAILAAGRALPLFGMAFPEDDPETALEVERGRVKATLGKRRIEDLIDLPETTDPEIVALMKVLMTVHTSIYFDNRYALYGWTLTRMVNLSLENGHIP